MSLVGAGNGVGGCSGIRYMVFQIRLSDRLVDESCSTRSYPSAFGEDGVRMQPGVRWGAMIELAGSSPDLPFESFYWRRP